MAVAGHLHLAAEGVVALLLHHRLPAVEHPLEEVAHPSLHLQAAPPHQEGGGCHPLAVSHQVGVDEQEAAFLVVLVVLVVLLWAE